MIVGQRLPLERLKVSHLELDADRSRLTNQTFRRVIATTCRYQRSVSVEGCTELTKEVFPLLAECPHLRDINLSATVCNDLTFLRGCTSLVNLTLSRTPLTSCEGVEHCATLRRLDLRHTGVADLSPLASCSHLRHLDLGGTPVEDLQPLASCVRLMVVYVDGTKVSSIDALAACVKLSMVNIGMTKVQKDLITPDIRSGVVVTKPRSLAWFEAVLRGKVEDMPAILQDSQWVDERANPFLKSLCMSCYENKCKRKTPFFSLAPDASRPTALHMAVLLGQELMIRFLIHHGADPKLKCWFGDIAVAVPALSSTVASSTTTPPAAGSKGVEVSAAQLADQCGEQALWGTIRDHYKRGLNTRRVCLEKAQRVRRLLRRDEGLTEEQVRIADRDS